MFSIRTFTARSVKTVRNYSTTTFNSKNIFRKENIPTFGFVIGVVALGVQIFLLYPWHHILSDQFDELQVGILRLNSNQTTLTLQNMFV